ncbi:Alpha-tocopherol transfer protein [Gonioctena quinquepunctata]|nr:Alpha-tocopherol transfer protein [Gonioctena quinquepunctata]
MVQVSENSCDGICSRVNPCGNHLDIIKNDLGENDDRLKIAENLLFRWIDCQTHFPKNYDKTVVRNFLRGSKHNMDRAKNVLESHFKAKSYYPDIFSNRRVSTDIISILKAVKLAPLPKLTNDGCRIFIFKISELDSNKINFSLIPKAFFMIYDVLLRNPNPIAKEVIVFDCEGASSSHLMKLLVILKPMITLLRQSYAIRLKEIHIINAHAGIEKVVSMLRPLLHPKLKNRVFLYQGIKNLLDHFDENVIPSNYGGKLGSLDELTEEWITILKNNEKWFEDQESVKISESVLSKKGDNSICFKDQNNLLHTGQYGFRNKKSTTLAINNLLDLVVEGLEEGLDTYASFYDLTKAIDSLFCLKNDHTIT